MTRRWGRVTGALGATLLVGAGGMGCKGQGSGGQPSPAQSSASAQPEWTPPPRSAARQSHPAPLANDGRSSLDSRKVTAGKGPCGPRQLPGGHWVHLDCGVHTPFAGATPPSVEEQKLAMAKAGTLRLDDPIAGGKLPLEVDHRTNGTEGPVKDQGQVGSCTSFSMSSAMDNAIRRMNKTETTSSLHIWSHYGIPSMHSAASGVLNKAIADWPTWPYDERVACELDMSPTRGDCGPYQPPVVQGAGHRDPAIEAKMSAAGKAGQWKVTRIDAIPLNPEAIATALATGADVWFSMEIGKSWMNPNGDTIADWTPATIDGGHAVLFAGYRHKNGQRQFLVHNSWGPEWADGGYAYVSEAMVREFTKNAYKVVVAHSTWTPPTGGPDALTDDDCGGDEVVDSVNGRCEKICPGGGRPANGRCK